MSDNVNMRIPTNHHNKYNYKSFLKQKSDYRMNESYELVLFIESKTYSATTVV